MNDQDVFFWVSNMVGSTMDKKRAVTAALRLNAITPRNAGVALSYINKDKADDEQRAYHRSLRRQWIANVNNGQALCIEGANSRMRRNWRKARRIAGHVASRGYNECAQASEYYRVQYPLSYWYDFYRNNPADSRVRGVREIIALRCSNY